MRLGLGFAITQAAQDIGEQGFGIATATTEKLPKAEQHISVAEFSIFSIIFLSTFVPDNYVHLDTKHPCRCFSAVLQISISLFLSLSATTKQPST